MRLVNGYELSIRGWSFGERGPYPVMMAAKTNVTRALKLKNRVCMCVGVSSLVCVCKRVCVSECELVSVCVCKRVYVRVRVRVS